MSKIQTLTYPDYAAINDGKRYELVEGELHEMAPSPGTPHQGSSFSLSGFFFAYIEKTGRGRAFAAPIDVILSGDTVLQPDFIYLSEEQLSLISQRGIEGAPSLVIEILSPSTAARDRGLKANLYFKHGAQEYWLIDPSLRIVEVFQRGSDRFDLARTYAGDDMQTSPLLLGFTLKVSRLFR